ncbi:uncharacterized protein VTP21DRAFT_3622 [Calcarisporiella thermophila]|uniref:uncharacterized protein n=1 Tax=Calcarisporiella thermophila TaxID=911321 RepID=UPI003741EB08
MEFTSINPSLLSCVLIQLIILCILGFAPLPYLGVSDKLLHSGGFGLLTLTLFFVWNQPLLYRVVLTLGVMIAAGIFSELVQGLLPYRTFDPEDIVANMLGISAGLLLGSLLSEAISRIRDRRAGYIPVIEMV